MHILLITHYFPPESNAPANRAFEHASAWVADGHKVSIVTAAPSHPRGQIYPGYANRFVHEEVGGIDVIRLPTFVAGNKGIVARAGSFFSFLLAVRHYRRRLPQADVVVSTSPQFFSGIAGHFVARGKVPWVLEVRDLWPESIVAVGAMKRNVFIRLLERLEGWAYRTADLIVTTTEAHSGHVRARGAVGPVVTIRNGITPHQIEANPAAGEAFRREHGLQEKFVAAYLGTHGMAHRLDTALDAAEKLRERDDIRILLVGDGAERARLVAEAKRRSLPNLVMLGQQRRETIPAILAATDAAMVLLKRSDTFKSVLPSKLVEAMAVGKPAILGVEGEAAILLAEADAGIAIPPQDSAALADAIASLADDRERATWLGANGQRYAREKLDRDTLARTMASAMQELIP
ncbi:MAG: glycosyltransferase family 4 protein [Sphingomonadaceae bacterium]